MIEIDGEFFDDPFEEARNRKMIFIRVVADQYRLRLIAERNLSPIENISIACEYIAYALKIFNAPLKEFLI